jgi:hypothetical protein
MSFLPTVLYPLTLAGLLHHILTTQSGTASTTLIICSSRDTFLHHLALSLQQDQRDDEDEHVQQLATPSLHNLFTTRHIKLAFCASVQALLAFLTAYGRHDLPHTTQSGQRARMVLVNPLALHASTMSFSAQGLSRSFAAVTETALKTHTVLHVVECQPKSRKTKQHDKRGDFDMGNRDEQGQIIGEQGQIIGEQGQIIGEQGQIIGEQGQIIGEQGQIIGELGQIIDEQGEDPWEQEVSILNVSVRRFGSNSSERAWVGRTVKAKSIAARWFQYQRLEDRQTREGQN